jgi:hypothetical protein
LSSGLDVRRKIAALDEEARELAAGIEGDQRVVEIEQRELHGNVLHRADGAAR